MFRAGYFRIRLPKKHIFTGYGFIAHYVGIVLRIRWATRVFSAVAAYFSNVAVS